MGKTDIWDWITKPLLVLATLLACALIFGIGHALLWVYDHTIDWLFPETTLD